jgi:hypothetical protein
MTPLHTAPSHVWLPIAANDAQQMTWCCIQNLCADSGRGAPTCGVLPTVLAPRCTITMTPSHVAHIIPAINSTRTSPARSRRGIFVFTQQTSMVFTCGVLPTVLPPRSITATSGCGKSSSPAVALPGYFLMPSWYGAPTWRTGGVRMMMMMMMMMMMLMTILLLGCPRRGHKDAALF